ncbi:ATP/GTP-binding protein [Streptomyces massasporeus]
MLKIVIAGGFGAGKTTAVGAVSEITPLSTEEYLTEASADVDSLEGVEAKQTTTVASDFAARLDLRLVRTETLARNALDAEPVAALLHRLTGMGWDVQGSGPGREGDRVARLELAAESRPGLSALIGCRVHEPQAVPSDRGSA